MSPRTDTDGYVAQRIIKELILQCGVSAMSLDYTVGRKLITFGGLSTDELCRTPRSIVRSTHPGRDEEGRVKVIERVLEQLEKQNVIETFQPIGSDQDLVKLSRKTLDVIEKRSWGSRPLPKNGRVPKLDVWARKTADSIITSLTP